MEKVLEAIDLIKTFKSRSGETVEALRGLSISVSKGEILAFLGPNGAGKTTTIRILAGLVIPDSGAVTIGGLNPLKNKSALLNIGTVLEGNRNLYWRLTALENLRYFAALKGIGRKEAAVRSADLLHEFGLSHKNKETVQTLSRGMQQKVAIAVALVSKPKVLLLDEPTLGLDIEAAQDVKQIVLSIAREGCSVILTTHQMEVAEELSNRTAIIRDGKLVAEDFTQDLLAKFSGQSYTITVDGDIPIEKMPAIEYAGGFVTKNLVAFRGEKKDLYAVISAMNPLPITKIEKDDSSLADVFLKLIKESKKEEKKASAEAIFR